MFSLGRGMRGGVEEAGMTQSGVPTGPENKLPSSYRHAN
jgi:hypothetical protein